jgi:hypothetical protein
MTASRAAPAPTRRPTPRAVVLAILGVALLGLFAVGAMQYATPQDDAARGVLVARVPGAPGATYYPRETSTQFGRPIFGVWITRDERGIVHALGARDDRDRPVSYVPAAEIRNPECFPAGWLAGFDNYNLDGTTVMGPGRLFRYPVVVEDGTVRVNLANGALVDRGARTDRGPRCP